MASLSKVTDGELTELKRILAEAGLDTSMVRGFNKKPELVAPWVSFGRDLLSGKASSSQGKASVPSASREPKLFKRADGSYGLKTTRLGLSDDRIVADFKAAGWWYINPTIRSDRRIEVPGKPEVTTGTKRILTIKKVVPSGEAWVFQKAVDTIGAPALAFDLEDLRNLVLGHEDELLKRGIYYVVAPAARFRDGHGYGCVAMASLGDCSLGLDWGECVYYWNDNAWFGSSK